VTVGVARKIESIRSMELIGIAIRSSNAKCQIRAGFEHHVAADDALHDQPVTQLVGALETQEFLYRAADQVRRVTQLRQRARVIEQGVEAVADEIGRRLVAGIQQEDAVVQQLGLGHLLFAQQTGQYVCIVAGVAAPLRREGPQIVAELENGAVPGGVLLSGWRRLQRAEYRQRPGKLPMTSTGIAAA
jgi:hypothetical protein